MYDNHDKGQHRAPVDCVMKGKQAFAQARTNRGWQTEHGEARSDYPKPLPFGSRSFDARPVMATGVCGKVRYKGLCSNLDVSEAIRGSLDLASCN